MVPLARDDTIQQAAGGTVTAWEIEEIRHAIKVVHGPYESLALLHQFERVLRAAGVLVQTPAGLVHKDSLPVAPA
jgi:hypothetical protein